MKIRRLEQARNSDRRITSKTWESTRMALREARTHGVHPFCITVDPAGGEYLGGIYGDVRYTVIDSVEQLPTRLPAIYRRLTT